MLRDNMLQEIENKTNDWDLIIIGGGATGIGAAIEACSRVWPVKVFGWHLPSPGLWLKN